MTAMEYSGPERRRAVATISDSSATGTRRTAVPKATSRSWRNGRCRERRAVARTRAMRSSPLSRARLGGSSARGRDRG